MGNSLPFCQVDDQNRIPTKFPLTEIRNLGFEFSPILNLIPTQLNRATKFINALGIIIYDNMVLGSSITFCE